MTRQEYFTLKKEKAQQKLDEYMKNPNYCECGCGQVVNMNCKRVNGHNNIGKKRSEKSKQKMAESQIGNHNKLGWRKDYTEKFCINCGKKLEGKQQKFCSNNCKDIGFKSYSEIKRKMRIFMINNVNQRIQNNQQIVPNWNPKACDYFEKFDLENNTQGQHARNGGEYHIKELGYWVDYINHEKKIIIEYDEKYHEKQKQKDIRRQEEIEKHFSDYKFYRIRESNLTEDLNLLMDLIQ